MDWKRQIIYTLYQNFLIMAFLCFVILMDETASAKNKKAINKNIPCDSSTNTVRVSTKKVTALSFLENPKELVPGNNSFDFKRVQNDIFIKALFPTAKTNMFVFVGSKRCRFNLMASEQNVDDLIEVREPDENIMEVEFNEK